MEACQGNEHLQNGVEKRNVLGGLAREAANARFCGECRAYHEAFTARKKRDKKTGLNFRQELAAKVGSKSI